MKFQGPYDNPYSQIDPSQRDGAHEYEMDPYGGNSSGYTKSNGSPSPDDMVAFFEEVDDMKRSIGEYDGYVDRVEALHQRTAAEVNDEQLQVLGAQMAALTEETAALAGALRRRLQALLTRSQYDHTKRVQADNVKTQLQASVRRYQGVEAAFRARYRDRAERQYRTVNPEASEEEVRGMVSQLLEEPGAPGAQVFSQALLNSNRRGEAQAALGEVQQRHRGIQQIAKTMEELAQLFQDLETMVAEQEAPVQQIEARAEQAQVDIEHGVGETHKAVKSARAARKKKWICLGICVLIIAIIALILGLVFGLKK